MKRRLVWVGMVVLLMLTGCGRETGGTPSVPGGPGTPEAPSTPSPGEDKPVGIWDQTSWDATTWQ